MTRARPAAHHSTVVSIQGEGYRLKDKRRAGLIHLPAGGVASRSTNSGEWTASGSPHAMHNSGGCDAGAAPRSRIVCRSGGLTMGVIFDLTGPLAGGGSELQYIGAGVLRTPRLGPGDRSALIGRDRHAYAG